MKLSVNCLGDKGNHSGWSIVREMGLEYMKEYAKHTIHT